MGDVVAGSRLSLQGPSDEPDLRLALVHETGANNAGEAGAIRSPAALATILAGDGVPPNAGVFPLRCADRLARHPPQVIVLLADLARPEGLAAVRYLHREVPTARIVVTARDIRGGLARQALNAGAEAFVAEHDAPEALAAAVRAVVAGLVCAPRITRRLVAKPTFTHRERETLELLVAGMTNRQIADWLFLAESTVKSHVTSAFAKLGVRSRKDAAAILLDPDEELGRAALPSEMALPRGRAASRVASQWRASAPAPAPRRERTSGR